MKIVHFSVMQVNYTFLASAIQIILLVGKSIYLTGSPTVNIKMLHGEYSRTEWVLLIFASSVNVVWMSCMAIANQLETSAFLSIFSYISFIYSICADLLIFEYRFTWQTAVGALVILSVSLFLAVLKLKNQK